MNRYEEDWGPALGQEEKESQPATKKAPKKKDSIAGLVYEFRDRLLLNPAMFMNAQVNAPALAKAFRKILDTGRTYDDIRQMIAQFSADITAKPLSDGIPAWRAFISRLDSLALKVKTSETTYTYDGPKIDPRLTKETHD